MKNRASRVVRRAVMAAGLVAFGFTAVADSLPPNAYIPRGLLYHWDGVDNQATGTHDPNAATWVDRVGKVALTKSGSGTVTVEDDGMVFDGSSCLTRGNGTFPADSVFPWTTEVHFKVNNVSADFHARQPLAIATLAAQTVLASTSLSTRHSIAEDDWACKAGFSRTFPLKIFQHRETSCHLPLNIIFSRNF